MQRGVHHHTQQNFNEDPVKLIREPVFSGGILEALTPLVRHRQQGHLANSLSLGLRADKEALIWFSSEVWPEEWTVDRETPYGSAQAGLTRDENEMIGEEDFCWEVGMVVGLGLR